MPRQFPLPAEYYDSPESGVRPLFPKWVPWGCGAASIAFLLLLFAGGSLVSSGGLGSLMAKLFDKMHEEMTRQYTSDVTPQQKSAFDSEMRELESNLRKGKAPLTKLQQVVQAMQDASSDGKVTPSEVDQIVKALDDVNREAAKPKPKP